MIAIVVIAIFFTLALSCSVLAACAAGGKYDSDTEALSRLIQGHKRDA